MKIIQTSRNIFFNKEDTKLYPIPGEEAEEICILPPTIPMATIVEVDDIDDMPTPDTEIAAPSMGMPDPGPRCSSWIADQGTCPDYTNRTHDHAMVTREIITEPENLKELGVGVGIGAGSDTGVAFAWNSILPLTQSIDRL